MKNIKRVLIIGIFALSIILVGSVLLFNNNTSNAINGQIEVYESDFVDDYLAQPDVFYFMIKA